MHKKCMIADCGQNENGTCKGNIGSCKDWTPPSTTIDRIENAYLNEEVKGCKKCKFLKELFDSIEDSTNRDYWLFTELFVMLHDGKDYCRKG